MLRKKSFLGIGIFAVGVAVAIAVPQNETQKPSAAIPAANPTVGDFVVKYASTMGLSKNDAAPDQAVAALKKAGALGSEPLDLSAGLTEGDVVKVSGKHLKISSITPARPFTNERFTEFFNVFGSDIKHAGRALNSPGLMGFAANPTPEERTPDFDPHGKGKGKGTSPHEP
jgi:hypothetical protein